MGVFSGEQTRRYLRWGLRALGPIMLLVVLWRLPRPAEIGKILAELDPWLLAASLSINFLAIHLKVVRWQLLLRVRGIAYGTKNAWLAFSSSAYLAMLTPGRVGDALRVQYLRHDEGTAYSEGLASVVMDRLCDLYVLAGFVAFAIAHYGGVLVGDLRSASYAVVALTLLGPLTLLWPGVAERLFRAMYRRMSRDPDGTGLDTFLTALRAQIGRGLLLTVPLTVIAFLVAFAQAWLLARAMGLHLAYVDVMCLTASASLLSLLPISVSGVGVREALFATIFPTLGQSVEQGVGYGIMVFLVMYLGVALVGFVCWQIRPPPSGPREPAPPA